MHQKGHLGVTLLTWAPVVAVTMMFFDQFVWFAVAGTVLLVNPLMPVAFLLEGRFRVLRGTYSLNMCMIPDIDMKLPGVKHRGFTHTMWFAGLFAVLCGAVGYVVLVVVALVAVEWVESNLWSMIAFSAYIGFHAVVSHILADAITPMGIRPFVPLSDMEFGLGLTKAGNSLANVILLVVGIIAVGVAFLLP